jgi:hypothetical protein
MIITVTMEREDLEEYLNSYFEGSRPISIVGDFKPLKFEIETNG